MSWNAEEYYLGTLTQCGDEEMGEETILVQPAMKVRMERQAEKTFMYYLSHDSAGKKYLYPTKQQVHGEQAM